MSDRLNIRPWESVSKYSEGKKTKISDLRLPKVLSHTHAHSKLMIYGNVHIATGEKIDIGMYVHTGRGCMEVWSYAGLCGSFRRSPWDSSTLLIF